MIQSTIFVVTFVYSLLGLLGILGVVFTGNKVWLPVPFLCHFWDTSFLNTYLLTPSLMYQTYYWYSLKWWCN